jgi:Ca2+-binding RTX toxin-like protein
MASFVLSSNPNTAFDPTTDILQIDTGAASKLLVAQVGSNVVITDQSGHTATLQNVLLAQIATSNVIDTDGSLIQIGDTAATVLADNNANALAGSAGGDYIMGLGGDDILSGGAGADLVYGNVGNDTVTTGSATAGNDTIFGGQGNDTLDYSGATTSGVGLIYGNLGNDFIGGGAGNDTLFGGQGNDAINGGAGTNLIYGNLGNDTITGTVGSKDTVFGGQDGDVINYSSLTTTSAVIYGNLGDDTLTGGASNDTMFGGQNNDNLDGGVGADLLTGGLGNDVFIERTNLGVSSTVADANTTSGLTTATADTIVDFVSGQDKIASFTSASASPAVPADNPGTFANYQEFKDATAVSAETAVAAYGTHGGNTLYSFIAGATDGYLVIDSNVGGVADSVIILKGLNDVSKFAFTDII